MQSILPNIKRKSEFVTAVDDDEIKHTLHKNQKTMKYNFDRKHNVQEQTALLPGTPLMVQRKEGDMWTYSIFIDVPEPNVHKEHCYKIKMSSARIVTRNSIHVHQTHVPAKTFLTDTDKQTETNNIPMYTPV